MLACVAVAGTFGACSGGGSGGTPTYRYSACGMCALDECEADIEACQAEGDCYEVLECELNCPADGVEPEGDCTDACGTASDIYSESARVTVWGCIDDAAAGPCASECDG